MILPGIVKKFEKALQKRNEVVKLERQLSMCISAKEPFATQIPIKQKLNLVIVDLYRAVEILEETGVVVKSVDEGLLDFPSKRFDEEIWLCWKYGETEIKFWHDKDSGFMGRKPIEVSDESLV